MGLFKTRTSFEVIISSQPKMCSRRSEHLGQPRNGNHEEVSATVANANRLPRLQGRSSIGDPCGVLKVRISPRPPVSMMNNHVITEAIRIDVPICIKLHPPLRRARRRSQHRIAFSPSPGWLKSIASYLRAPFPCCGPPGPNKAL